MESEHGFYCCPIVDGTFYCCPIALMGQSQGLVDDAPLVQRDVHPNSGEAVNWPTFFQNPLLATNTNLFFGKVW